jgi:hypothetical protein
MFSNIPKKTALDIIGSARKDIAKAQVKEATKQIYELGIRASRPRDHQPVRNSFVPFLVLSSSRFGQPLLRPAFPGRKMGPPRP